MPSAAQSSKGSLLTGRIITVLVVLFLTFDSITKIIREPHVMASAAEMGISGGLLVGIGAILACCVIIYLIPRTAVLGAVLLTGYLGGAIASNLLAHHPFFESIFPLIFGVLVWAGLFPRDERARLLFAPR